MSQVLHSCPDEPTTRNRFLSTILGVGTGEGASLLTPLPELFSGTRLLSPLASSADAISLVPRCRACGCLTRSFARSFAVRYLACPQCELRSFEPFRPWWGACDYGYTLELISDLASCSLYRPPATRRTA